jgi:outer membrane protein OmpA-like peptidoglycan-associated protein
MRTSIAGTLAIGALAASFSVSAPAQEVQRGVAVISEDVGSQIPVFSYREGPESKLLFRGTALAPRGEGDGEVEFQDGRARIEVDLKELPDPWSLGPYTTYVLWALTLEGRPTNLGTLIFRQGYGDLETSAPLSQFALIVSAEPHFAVTAPSKAVVMRNLAKRVYGEQSTVKTLLERADYANLPAQSIDPSGKVPLDLYQARYAVAIAAAAGAEEFAPEGYKRAADLLQSAERAQASKKSAERKTAPLTARNAVQAAEDARREAALAKTAAAEKAAREAQAQAAAAAASAAAAEEAARQAAIAAEAAAEQARRELEQRLDAVLPTYDTERGLVARMSSVQFGSGTAALGASAREALARFSGIVASYPGLKFMVEGYTDDVGSVATNEALSLSRAIAVRDYLIAQGVAASKIDVAGRGPENPIADNVTAEGRAQNRRVEIVMSGDPLGTD